MQTTVNISPSILDWVWQQVDATSSAKAKDYLTKWRNGEQTPTFNQIEEVSRITSIPLGYFFLDTPPEENTKFVEYRTIDSVALNKPSRNLIDTMHDMDMIQEWTRDYLIANDSSKIPFIGKYAGETDINFIANEVRRILSLKLDWYKDKKIKTAEDSFRVIKNAISNNGVIVMISSTVGANTHRLLDIDEFRAFTMIDDIAPLIFINSNDSANGKLFSLLHEFIHLCMGENSLFNDRYSNGKNVKQIETICNAVAAEILVPKTIFEREWNCAINQYDKEQVIHILARIFVCGQTVIARKAYDLRFINYALYDKIAKAAVAYYIETKKRKKEKQQGHPGYYTTKASQIDKRFIFMLAHSVVEGKTLYSDAFRLTHTNRSTFESLINKIIGGGN